MKNIFTKHLNLLLLSCLLASFSIGCEEIQRVTEQVTQEVFQIKKVNLEDPGFIEVLTKYDFTGLDDRTLISSYTILQKVVSLGEIEDLKKLLIAGMDINEKNVDVPYAPAAIHIAVREGNAEMVEFLIKAGADIRATDAFQGNTPLHIASKKEHPEIVRLLVQAGANSNTENISGTTPLHYAALSNNLAIAKILVEEGNANVNPYTKGGTSPLDHSESLLDRVGFLRGYLDTKLYDYLKSKGAKTQEEMEAERQVEYIPPKQT